MKILIIDYHAGCQIWQIALLELLGHEVVVDSLSGHSHLIPDKYKQSIMSNNTKTNLNIRNLNPLNKEESEYISKNFDVVISSFPPKCIDLFKNVSCKKILNCGHRINACTENDEEFTSRIIDSSRKNDIILASMSLYDSEYIKHYTGITPIQLEVACFHIPKTVKYNPMRNEILISPVHATCIKPFNSIEHMNSLASNYNLIFSHPKSLYSDCSFENLSKHRAAVLFPYSVFSISMIEMYEIGIPLFVPSIKLLISTGIADDVLLYPNYSSMEFMNKIDIPSKNSNHIYSPNSFNSVDREYWMNYAWFNNKKHIIFWDSIDDLLTKLVNTDLNKVSELMQEETYTHRNRQLQIYKNVLDTINKS